MKELLQKVAVWLETRHDIDDVMLLVHTDGVIILKNYYSEEVVFEAKDEEDLIEYMDQEIANA
jgi:hypothetical protein